MEDLLLFPFNGNAIEALECIADHYHIIGFIDDEPSKQGKSAYGFPVFDRSKLETHPATKILAVPGSPNSFMIRDKIIQDLNINDHQYATLIHPTAVISKYAKIGKNVLIMAGVVLTSNVIIGDHVCILPNTVIHHDSTIGDYTLIGSNVTIAGYSNILNKCYIGSGTSIINGITVGKESLVGMGSNVIKSIPDNSKVVGNPARKI
jgi:sugar O-acyltransferase (sialic acid O-acetyltransferase NeuD family)